MRVEFAEDDSKTRISELEVGDIFSWESKYYIYLGDIARGHDVLCVKGDGKSMETSFFKDKDGDVEVIRYDNSKLIIKK